MTDHFLADEVKGCPPHHWQLESWGENGRISKVCLKCGEKGFDQADPSRSMTGKQKMERMAFGQVEEQHGGRGND